MSIVTEEAFVAEVLKLYEDRCVIRKRKLHVPRMHDEVPYDVKPPLFTNSGGVGEFYYAKVRTQCERWVYMIGITMHTFEERYAYEDPDALELLERRRVSCMTAVSNYEKALKVKYAQHRLPPEMKTCLQEKGNRTRSTEIFTFDILERENSFNNPRPSGRIF